MKILQPIQPVPTGFFLEEDELGWLYTVIPEEGVNLIENPTFLEDIVGGSPDPLGYTFSAAYARMSPAPFDREYLQLTGAIGNNLAYPVNQTLTAGESYTFSVWMRKTQSSSSADVFIRVTESGGSIIDSPSLTLNVEWAQYHVTVVAPVTNNTYGVSVGFTSAGDVDVAGFQLEHSTYPTTMIAGYLGEGYEWAGIAGSSESLRLSTVIRGGRLVNLKELGMRLVSLEGGGLPPPDHVIQQLALRRGSLFKCTTMQERDWEFAFNVYGCNLKDLLCKRNDIGEAIFDENLERTFVFQPTECGVPKGRGVRFIGVYADGFEQALGSPYGEEIAVEVTSYDVEVEHVYDTCTPLLASETLTHSPLVGVRDDGTVNTLLGGPSLANGFTKDMAIGGVDGNLYVAIEFGGSTKDIYCYDGTSWLSIAQLAPLTAEIVAIESIGNYLYVGMGQQGVLNGQNGFVGASGNGVARINLVTQTVDNIGSVSVALPPGAGGLVDVKVSAFAEDDVFNDVYVAGTFSAISGVSSNHFIKYVPGTNTWVDPETHATLPVTLGDTNGGVRTLAYHPTERKVYIGGDFTSASPLSDTGVPNAFAIYDTVAQTYGPRSAGGALPVGTLLRPDFPMNPFPTPGDILDIAIYNGKVVLCGEFDITHRTGVSSGDVFNVVWFDEGAAYDSLSSVLGTLKPLGGYGVTNLALPLYQMKVIGDTLHVVGDAINFYSIGLPLLTTDTCGEVTFVSPSSDLSGGVMAPSLYDWASVAPSTCVIRAIVEGNFKVGARCVYSTDNDIGTSITSEVAGVTQLTLCDTYLDVPARIYVRGPGDLLEITSLATNASLFFEYSLDQYEVLEVDLTSLPAQITSSTGANVSNILLPSSAPAAWRLLPSQSSVRVKINNSTAETAVWLCYNEQAYSIEAIFCGC